MHRRKVLVSAGVALTSLTGCVGENDDTGQNGTPEQSPTVTSTKTESPTETATPAPEIDPDELDGYIRPDGDPKTIPEELVCDDEEFKRRSGWINEDELQWGDLSDEQGNAIFSLRVNKLTVERGEKVTFTLTNVSGETQEMGAIYKANFDVFSEAGWQDPRGWIDGEPKPIVDILVELDPGE